jgi:hypothetical protein
VIPPLSSVSIEGREEEEKQTREQTPDKISKIGLPKP